MSKTKFPYLHGFAPGVWAITGDTADSIQLVHLERSDSFDGDPNDINELLVITAQGFAFRVKAAAVNGADYEHASRIPAQFGPDWRLPQPIEAIALSDFFEEVCDTLKALGKPCWPMCVWTNRPWPIHPDQAIYAELRCCLLDVDLLDEAYGVVIIKQENY